MRKSLVILASVLLVLGIVGVGFAAEATDTTTATVDVNSFLSVSVDDDTITFSGLDPLETGKPTNDPLVATIGSESNVASIYVKTGADGTDFCTDYPSCTGTGGEYKFPVSNMEWDVDDTFPGTDYTTGDATVCSGLSASGTCSIYHELTIPSGQTADTYSVGMTVTATTVA